MTQPQHTNASDAAAGAGVVADVPFVDLRAEYVRMQGEIDAAMASVIDSTDFVLGDAVSRFEEAFAAYCETDHAVGVDSGFSALELMLRAFGVGPGDEVITAANTFVATVRAVEAVGATPVLVDVDQLRYTLDADQVKASITASTRAIVPVHLYGQPADMAALTSLADEHGLFVLEDACQAHGARYRGARTGSLGHAAAFSFYPSKNLGAFGDGGMVVTDDVDVAEQLRLLRNLGVARKYHHEIAGYNRRLDTLHAAVLEVKLQQLDAANGSRVRVAAQYLEALDGLPLQLPHVAPEVSHVFHLFVVEVGPDVRTALQQHLRGRGIATGIHYPVPIHRQPMYADHAFAGERFPATDRAASRILSLPIFPHMPQESLDRVIEGVRSYYG